ncbi:MAG: histone deacetylase family protein [Gemmatimonadales bacterium]
MTVFTSRTCLTHRPGGDHPDQPERLACVLRHLERDPTIEVRESPAAPIDALTRCHDPRYLERAAALAASGGGELGPDTPMGPESWTATIGASGAVLAALDHAVHGWGTAFAAVRPPGHHALHDRAMGFCVVNHVVVAAMAARASGADRVLIVDWDVHHGNGTQALVEREPGVHFVSMHRYPWYPGTGAAEERGVGNCFNLPMSPSLPPATYVETLWRGIGRATTAWTPDLVLISAGYDAMLGDPLGGFTLEPEHFATWVNRLREAFPRAPIVAVMEGGYRPERLAAGVLATVRALDSAKPR